MQMSTKSLESDIISTVTRSAGTTYFSENYFKAMFFISLDRRIIN